MQNRSFDRAALNAHQSLEATSTRRDCESPFLIGAHNGKNLSVHEKCRWRRCTIQISTVLR